MHKIIIEIYLYLPPLLALSQVMCLTPASCACPGLGGREEQPGSLAAAVVSSLFQSEMLETEVDELSTPVVDSQES